MNRRAGVIGGFGRICFKDTVERYSTIIDVEFAL